jgi:hypothetical protein
MLCKHECEQPRVREMVETRTSEKFGCVGCGSWFSVSYKTGEIFCSACGRGGSRTDASLFRLITRDTVGELAQPKHEGECTHGRKDDTGKDRWDLLPWDATRAIVRVLTRGAEKYAPDNWKKVPDARNRYFAAAQRHMTAWWEGEELDPETGESHLAHAGCCILFLLALSFGTKGNDK